MLDPRRLLVLSEVARTGSLSSAADALGFTQPAISHHVARLEAEVGTEVLERTARGVRPTAAGALLARHGASLAAQLARAEAELADLLGLRAATLVLAGFPTAFADLIPHAVARLRARYPDLAIELRTVDRPTAEAAIKAGELDVAIVFGAGEALLEDPMRVVLPRGHRLAGRPVVPLRELSGEPWIAGSGGLTLDAAREAGFEPDVVFASDDPLAVQGFVAAGLGVALAPALAMASVRDDVVVREVAVGGRTLTRTVGTLHRAGPAARAALEALRASVDRL